MKISKFLFLVSVTTLIALLYVYQQSEIFRLAYLGQRRSVAFQDLLDKNTILRYNIETNASLIRLGSKVTKEMDYEMPGSYQLVKLSYPLEKIKVNAPQRQNLLVRFFSIKREAEARTINP